ncbi:MAG: right-handed parallel beta-helix repeat-containing protein [Gemmatimonadota bacterium]
MTEATANRTRSAPGHLTLTVGPGRGDLQGSDDKALQAGVEYLQRLGGGILQVLPGQYEMRNALYLRPGVTLRGSGPDTVLHKTPSVCSALVQDSDWYENRVTVADAAGFTAGCGLMLRTYRGGHLHEVVKRTVVEVRGNDLVLDRRLLRNSWLEEQATAATLFPILTAVEGVCGVRVESLVLDGDGGHNEEVNGNYAGAVFLQECDRITFSEVVARNYNGDGYSFQVCDDVRFESCRAEDNANLGFHPGSGSQRPLFRDCVSRGNAQGIFFCWGVADGLVDGCECCDNRDFGISIGHRDTDNRVVRTRIVGNHKVGLLFREQTEFRGPHRNLVELCEIGDNGFAAEGVGLDVRGRAEDNVVRNCRFADSGAGRQKIGVRLGPDSRNTQLTANTFAGLARDVEEL